MIGATYWSRATMPRGRTYRVCVDDVLTMLSRPYAARCKSELPGWSPCTFRGGYRAMRYWIEGYACGVDVDGGATLAEILAAWGDAWGYVHSTPSSTPAAPRWRVILFFAAPMTDAADMRRVIRWAQRRTPGDIDRSTCDPSRLWYRPWSGAAHFSHAGLVGEPLDAHAVAAEERAREEREREDARALRFVPPPPTDGTYAARALHRACAAVASATEGERHATLTREAWNIGTLVGAGLLSLDQAHHALDAASRAVFPANRNGERVRTLGQQLVEGAKHPREVRRSPWS